jgi:hypothetical protein
VPRIRQATPGAARLSIALAFGKNELAQQTGPQLFKQRLLRSAFRRSRAKVFRTCSFVPWVRFLGGPSVRVRAFRQNSRAAHRAIQATRLHLPRERHLRFPGPSLFHPAESRRSQSHRRIRQPGGTLSRSRPLRLAHAAEAIAQTRGQPQVPDQPGLSAVSSTETFRPSAARQPKTD